MSFHIRVLGELQWKHQNVLSKIVRTQIDSIDSLFEDKNDDNVIVAAVDLKIYYNYPHERLELSEEEERLDNQVFNLSQRVEKEIGIRLLEVNTY